MPSLIDKKFNQIYIPKIFASLARAVILGIDSIVAAQVIGTSALAAITLSIPFLSVDEALHDILGSGIITHVAQYVGAGKREKANRMMGAVIPAVLILYTVVFLPMVLNMDRILGLFSDDAVMIRQTTEYIIPMIAAMPFFEVLLCLEKAYQIDGRSRFFACRSVISTGLNVVLDVLFVAVLDCGMRGLAAASIISTTLGFTIVAAHGFSRKCSIRPDFRVLANGREALSYLKVNALTGGTWAVTEGFHGVVNAAMCKALALCGGTESLAVWNLFQFLLDLTEGCMLGMNAGMTLLGGAFFGEEDYDGVRIIARRTLKKTLTIGALFLAAVLLFAGGITGLYGITGSVREDCIAVLRMTCGVYPLYAVVRMTVNYWVTIDRLRLSYTAGILEKLLILLCMAAGLSGGMKTVFLGYAFSYVLMIGWILFLFRRSGHWMLESNGKRRFASYSVCLTPEELGSISSEVQREMTDAGYSSRTALFIALLIEDGGMSIHRKNPGREVHADIRLCLNGGKMCISITDDGIPNNASIELSDAELQDDLEQNVIRAVSEDVRYDRILELNFLNMKLTL